MLLIGLGVFLFALFGIGWYLHDRTRVWTNDAYLDGYQVQISSDIEARIINLLVDEGDSVTKGQLLCQLDQSILNSKKQDAKTLVELSEKTVSLQRVQVEKLHDIFIVAQKEYANQIISFIDFDKIEKDYLYAIANLKVAQAKLANAIAKLGVIEELLRHTHIFAPCNGSIGKRWATSGDVALVSEPIFNLTDTQNIWVNANLEETKVAKVQPGDRVKILVDAYPDKTFYGKVFKVRASAASRFSLIPPNNATGNFTKIVQRVPVKILMDPPNENLYLYPGMSVEVTIHTSKS